MRTLIKWALIGTSLVALAWWFPVRTAGQAPRDVTFSKDVAPILFAKCAACHRPGEVAPFSLLSFRDARPWAQSIKQQVVRRAMPPWKADPHFGEFRDPRVLSDQEVATVVAWVDGGAREGNPTEMPAAPTFTEGWQIGTPDVVLTMKEPVAIPSSGTVPYASYPTDFVLDRDVWVQAIEIRPGNRRVVHHAVAQADLPGVANGPGGSQNVHLYSPGLEAMVWREGYGKFFPKGTRFSFQMHYNAIGRETTDQSKIGLKFAAVTPHTQVNTSIVLNNTLLVPPMVQKHEVIAAFQFPSDARIHALRPHMHLRARLGTASLVQPNGSRKVLLHIPDWDDAWQNYYVLARPARVGKGFIEYLASYDNSPANALNPDPLQPVPWGQQVWDEMHSTYMTWTAVNDRNKDDDEPIQIPPARLFMATATARP